mmetsp:Transcript_9133/g.23440  ORF Transcript_9133/g.23440 Transcript_9133/m.23440 type:complete len:319 (+) Transcript_9133:578-1534(+)
MSAYTLSSGDRLNRRWSTVLSLRSNQRWMLMTGMPSSWLRLRKYAMSFHAAGRSIFSTSTGTVEMYASASNTLPSASVNDRSGEPGTAFVAPAASAASTLKDLRRALRWTWPPLSVMRSAMGWQSRVLGGPSRKAIFEPLFSCRKRLSAVSTTVMDSSSGLQKLSALDMATKTSSFTRSGTFCFRIHSDTEYLSCSSTYFCPRMMAGSKPKPNWIFSGHVSMSLLRRMATRPFQGAGMSGKSKRLNSPGLPWLPMAKIIEWHFHWRRSSMSSSFKRFIMFGYAPKKMCSPVSYQSPSSSWKAATFPPSTSRPSSTMGT